MSEHPGVEAMLLGVVVEAQRAFLHARRPHEVADALEHAVLRLGGSVVPAHQAAGGAIPVDVALGVGPPRLTVVDDGVARSQLERVLPRLVEDGRAAVHRLWALEEAGRDHPRLDRATGTWEAAATEEIAGRLGPGDAIVGMALPNAAATAAVQEAWRRDVDPAMRDEAAIRSAQVSVDHDGAARLAELARQLLPQTGPGVGSPSPTATPGRGTPDG